MLGLLGLSVATATGPLTVGVLAVVGIWLLIPKFENGNGTPVTVPDAANKSTNETIVELKKAVIEALKTESNEPTEVSLNFQEMRSMHDTYGVRGVYAYLITKGIAKDERHGDFIINDIFLPELNRRLKEEQAVTLLDGTESI